MKPRVWVSLLVMAIGITVAAVAQSFLPLPPPLRLPAPLLLGTAIYYCVRREAGYGLLCALWCGVFEDGLGGVPLGASLAFFAATWWFCRFVVRRQMPETTLSCAVAGAALAPLLLLAQYFAFRATGGCLAFPLLFLLARFAASVFAGALATGLMAFALHALDWISANVGLEDERDALEDLQT